MWVALNVRSAGLQAFRLPVINIPVAVVGILRVMMTYSNQKIEQISNFFVHLANLTKCARVCVRVVGFYVWWWRIAIKKLSKYHFFRPFSKFDKCLITPTCRWLFASKNYNRIAIYKLISVICQDVASTKCSLINSKNRSQFQKLLHCKDKFTIFKICLAKKCKKKDTQFAHL